MSLILAMILLGVTVPIEGEIATGSILVNVVGFESDEGQAVLVLFTEDEFGFPPDPAEASLVFTGEINDLACNFEISDINYGEYMALAFHDANGNGILDGEDEAFGLSGEEHTMAGPPSAPSFSDICLTHDGVISSVEIVVEIRERPEEGGRGGQGGGPGGGGGGRPGGM